MARDFRNLSRQVAIIGVAEPDQMGIVPDKSPIQLHAEAAWNAMEDAGVKKEEIDAVFTAGLGTLQQAEYFGIFPRYTDGTSVGGSSFVIHVGHAAMAIANIATQMSNSGNMNPATGRLRDRMGAIIKHRALNPKH